MRPTSKRIDEARALELRTRWLAQRLRFWGKINISYVEFPSEDGRLQELISPLLVMAELFGGQEAREAVERYGREIEREIFAMEITSDDSLILQAVINIIESNENDAPDFISVKAVVDELNKGLSRPEWSSRSVGRRLSALGFKKDKRKGVRGYVLDLNLLARLASRYGVNTWSLDTLQTNVQNVQMSKPPQNGLESRNTPTFSGHYKRPELSKRPSEMPAPFRHFNNGDIDTYIFHSFVLPSLIASYNNREKLRGRFSGLPNWSKEWVKDVVEVPGDWWLSYITCRCNFRVLTVHDFLSHLRGWHGIKEVGEA